MTKAQTKQSSTSFERGLIPSSPTETGPTGPSFTEHLIHKLGAPIVSNCKKCFGLGFLYKPGTHFDQKGGFSLCSCIANLCREEHCYPPYERYNSQKQELCSCECRLARLSIERIRRLEKRSQIPYKYAGHFLDHVRLDHVMGASLITALDHAEEIVSHFSKIEERPLGLYLRGGTGAGKTLVSCAILNEIIRFHKAPVRYAKISRDILSKLRASFNPNSDIYGEGFRIEEELGSVAALVIDDFGSHRETNWVQSVLYDLIDRRYENNLLTIITSNEPMSFWKDTAGGRIYSRLQGMCKEVFIEAPDYRVDIAANTLPTSRENYP